MWVDVNLMNGRLAMGVVTDQGMSTRGCRRGGARRSEVVGLVGSGVFMWRRCYEHRDEVPRHRRCVRREKWTVVAAKGWSTGSQSVLGPGTRRRVIPRPGLRPSRTPRARRAPLVRTCVGRVARSSERSPLAGNGARFHATWACPRRGRCVARPFLISFERSNDAAYDRGQQPSASRRAAERLSDAGCVAAAAPPARPCRCT